MPRPPVRKTRKLAEAEAYGKTIGEQKALKKIWKTQGIEGLIRYFSQKLNPQDAIDIALNVGLAFLSLQAFGTVETTDETTKEKKTTFQPLAAIYGPLALALIRAPAGTIPLAQIAGLGLLAGMGLKLSGALNAYSDAVEKAIENGTWVNPWETH